MTERVFFFFFYFLFLYISLSIPATSLSYNTLSSDCSLVVVNVSKEILQRGSYNTSFNCRKSSMYRALLTQLPTLIPT